MIDVKASSKIKAAGFLCTIMVVFRHSLNLQAFWGTEEISNVCSFIEFGCSTLTELAVPFFFMVSGFFFFKYNYYESGTYLKMLRKKVRTLFVPYVIWNIIGLIILLVTFQFLFYDKWYEYVMGLVLSDYYGALWYVRNLMLLMLIVPIYNWIYLVNSKMLYLIILFILLYFWVPVDCSWNSVEGILFFFIGGVFSKFPSCVSFKSNGIIVVLLSLLWVSLCFLHPFWSSCIHKITTLTGVFCFWQLLDWINANKSKLLSRLSKYSFFIYVTHLYFIKAFKVLLAHIFPANEIVALCSYIFLPIFTVSVLGFVGSIWNMLDNKSFSLFTGGRN